LTDGPAHMSAGCARLGKGRAPLYWPANVVEGPVPAAGVGGWGRYAMNAPPFLMRIKACNPLLSR
jgi:hypothetical protein